MKCSVYCKFAPNTKSPFGGAGVGARDFQKSSCRNHDQSKVHLAAMEAERLSEGTEVRQRNLLNMLSSDPVMARVVKCMQGAHWIARNDAPIALYPMLVRFMAEQGCPDMMTDESYGRYYLRYVLVSLFDITEVKNHVDKVKTKVSQYYVEPGASNGPNTSRLNKFLAAHGSKDKRKMELKGVDENGKHEKAEIELHEDIIDPENPWGGCDLEACVDLARRFAQRLIKALGKRMADLRHFDGVGVALADIEPQMRLFTATMEKNATDLPDFSYPVRLSAAVMATPTVLAFDAEGRAIDFAVWIEDLQLYLLGRPAMLLHVLLCVATSPSSERAHFSQCKTAQALYDAVVARYSSPSSATLSCLMLPFLFPDLAAFPTVADLVTHLRASDARYRAALPAEFRAANPPPMYITLYFLVTRLPESLHVVRDQFLSVCPTTLTVDLLEESLLAAEKSIVAVGASRGDPRTPIFEGRSVRRLPPAVDAAMARAKGARERVELEGAVAGEVGVAGGVGVAVEVVAGVEVLVEAVEADGGGGGGSGGGGGEGAGGGGGGGDGGGGGGGVGGGGGGSGWLVSAEQLWGWSAPAAAAAAAAATAAAALSHRPRPSAAP
ncbi:unnamed protein product [Closterium sp. NIES-64]|nr:unnamed protein product [Closterium sp. NIES-64]